MRSWLRTRLCGGLELGGNRPGGGHQARRPNARMRPRHTPLVATRLPRRLMQAGYLLGLCSAFGGCGDSSEHRFTEMQGATPPPPQAGQIESTRLRPSTAESKDQNHHEPEPGDSRFLLRSQVAQAYSTGQLASFAIELETQNEWHINQDYPIRVVFDPSGRLEFPKSELQRPDAAMFDEMKARFDVPFVAVTAGEHECRALVDFAVCTEATCVPVRKSLAVRLSVVDPPS
ncbi:MAG: hypothetical protein AAF355_06350 [Myxococcota bacterium]